MYNKNGVILHDLYSQNSIEISQAYNVSGKAVFLNNRIDYGTFVATPLMTVPSSSFANAGMQGMAIYGGVLFQFISNNSVSLIDIADGSLIAKLTVTSDHGDAVSFSDEFYDQSDEFPLLYVTSDTTPAKIYVLRVSRESAELVRTLTFPSTDTGYYAAHAHDYKSKTLYTVGYRNQDYQTDSNGNEMIVSKWDLSGIERTDSGTIYPTKLDSFTVPFIYVSQDQTFHDGLIFITSGYPNTVQKLYIVDPIAGEVYQTVTLVGTSETEGIDFVADDMIIGQRPFSYTKYTFSTD